MLFFQHGWGMMSLHQKGQKRPSIGFCQHTVLGRSFYKNRELFTRREKTVSIEPFINTMDTMNDNVHLNYDAKLCILAKGLFNDNFTVARAFSKMPACEATKRLEQSEKAKYLWPITIEDKELSLEHYMCMTQLQALILSDSIKNGFIDEGNVEVFEHAVKVLKKFDPKLICDEKKLTDSIKLYPSLRERRDLFWNAPSNTFYSVWLPGIGTIIVSGSQVMISSCISDLAKEESVGRIEHLNWCLNGWLRNKYMGLGFIGLGISLQIANRYCNYNQNLKNNILTVQPALTQVLSNSSS